jgi:hypothetical protein
VTPRGDSHDASFDDVLREEDGWPPERIRAWLIG